MIDCARIPLAANSQSAGYLFDSTMLYLIGYAFKRGLQNISIVYTAGFTTIPFEIAQACIDLVALKYKEMTRIGLQSQTLGNEMVSYRFWDLTSNQKGLLTQYKKVVPI
jgi:hypothetical protein